MSFKICMIFFLCNTKTDILKNVGNWIILVSIDFHIWTKNQIARSVNQNCLVTNILQIIFCFQQKKIRWLNNDRIFIYELTILLTYL